MARDFNYIFPAEICVVQDKPYLFSNVRVNRDSIPEPFCVYDVGDDNDGEFWRIQRFVIVNHWATIIGLENIKLNEISAYYPKPDPEDENLSSEGWFIDDYCENAIDFINRYEEIKESIIT